METPASEALARSRTSLGRRERKKLATRTALHRAALTLFAENGFRRTRISEISDAADVSESTFFRYFDSKEGVALEGIRQRAEALVAAVHARPLEESPIAACLAVNRSEAMHRDRIQREDLPGLELLRSTPEVATKAHRILLKTVSQLAAEFARRLGEDASNIEVRLQTHAVLAASIAALEGWIANPDGSDPQRLAEYALTRLRDGFNVTTELADTARQEH